MGDREGEKSQLSARIAGAQARVAALTGNAPGSGGDADPAAKAELSEHLARIELRWAEIFKAIRSEREVLTEQNEVFRDAVLRLSGDVEQLERKLAAVEAEVERLQLIEISQQAEVKAAVVEAFNLRKSLAEAQNSVAKLREEAQSREATLTVLQDEQVARAAADARVAAVAGRRKIAGLLPSDFAIALAPKSRRKMQRHRQVRALVSASGLFDAKFYASRYPDVIAAGEDPLDHFIRFGGAEGRHPSLSFNAKWYLTENPDIKGAGLNPLVHYLEYGRDEGRRRRTLVDTGASQVVEASSAPQAGLLGSGAIAAPPPSDIRPAASDFDTSWAVRRRGWLNLLGRGNSGRDAVVPLEQLAGQENGRPLAIGEKVVAVLRNGEPAGPAVDRVALFCALRGPASGNVTLGGMALTATFDHALLVAPGLGIELLADGWHDSQNSMTLRFANGFVGVARAFQFNRDGDLASIGEVRLSGTDADLVELRLCDPLAEVLVLLCSADGALADAVALPFPSLLRGGLHYGELAVIETAPGTTATLADYSRVLALEWMGWAEGPQTCSVSRVEVDMRGASGIEPLFRPDIAASLASRFGISVGAKPDSVTPQRSELVATLGQVAATKLAGRTESGGVLTLPCDSLPSIYALVSRRLSHDGKVSRLAVVDAATLKPRAYVTVPQTAQCQSDLQHADLPLHLPTLALAQDAVSEDGGPAFAVAVRHHNRIVWQGDPLMPVSPDQDLGSGPGEGAAGSLVTAIIDASGGDDALLSCLASLAGQIGVAPIEIVLAGWADGRTLPETSLKLKTAGGKGLSKAARLNAAAALADGSHLLFIDSEVLLSDPRTVAVLLRMAGEPGAASAACALVTEHVDGGGALVHSAGYFPARISLSGEPVFEVCQAELADILPAATFPVVANHALCNLVDGDAWRALGGFDATKFPVAMFDLDFGLRAVAGGYSNYCTTLVRAATRHAIASADFPDAVAHRSIRPADWQALFDRVTVIRELRR